MYGGCVLSDHGLLAEDTRDFSDNSTEFSGKQTVQPRWAWLEDY